MGQRNKNRVAMTFTIDRRIEERLDECKNKSEVVNMILLENLGLIGDSTEEDRIDALKARLRRDLERQVVPLLKDIIKSIINETDDKDDG